MTRKDAIFEPNDQLALLGACESDNEYIPIWLMMNCGMHPSDVASATKEITIHGHYIEWRRAKNDKPRREPIPLHIHKRLENWLKHGRKLTRNGYYYLVKRIGERVGHPEYTPSTLRHTFGINMLRYYHEMANPPPDIFKLVAKKMGCSENVVRDYYISLTDWERLGRS